MTNRAARRSVGAKYPADADIWNHDLLVKGMVLPAVGDGPLRQVDIEVPNLATMAMRGHLPDPLVPIALKVADGYTLRKLTDEDKRPYYDLMCWVIATHLRRPNLVEQADGDAEAAAAMVAEKIPDEHKWAIWLRCVHVFDPDDLLLQLQEGGALGEAVNAASLTDVATFPDEPRGAAVHPGGEVSGAPGQ